ncbi:hypothetical protein BGX34_011964 [Mortierella sp. NVP85]|nr:hypothetical protein BGX34_011964 [Mortierella sp. NVP85]
MFTERQHRFSAEPSVSRGTLAPPHYPAPNMMSNANPGIMDPAAVTGQGGPSNPRNIQFRVPVSQQQQLHHHHHHHQQRHEASGHGSVISNSQARLPSNASLSHQQQQQHSIQYSHPSSQHGPYNANMQPLSQHPHQQRPPIPPAPRLYHSASLGNIANAGRHGAGQNGGTPNAVNAALPKKKDPYATAWRTYSKIAEELHLRNPDGSLYPISKEAILKYLHHQSKRIKSTNLHWYVNGLKKHQENLGYPWDDVRYDEQVVGLLKELTLHPANATENGDDDGYGGHAYGSQPNRQRQSRHPGGSSLTKRKRDEFAFKKRRVPSTMSMEGEDNEDDELQDDELKDDFEEDRHGHDMDDFDEMEDPNRYQPLKRRASTGTLLSQARAQAVKHIPGSFTLDQYQHGSSSHHPYSYQRMHPREPSAGGNDMIHRRNPSDLQQQHLRSPSPNSRDNEPGDGSGNATGGNSGGQYSLSHRPNDSPPASTSSNSSIGGSIQLGDKESMQRCRNANSGGAATSPRNSVLPMVPEPPSSTIPSASNSTSVTGGKTTVQFSEVVERAQQLQAKYGNRCKLHPWGCVEITEHRHLELTIKMRAEG